MQLTVKDNTIRICGELMVERWPQYVEACGLLVAARRSGEVPGVDVDPPQPTASSSPTSKGPGDHLHDVIMERMAIEPTAGCGCEAMIALMNQMGVEFCEAGRDIIIERMVEQGKLQLAGTVRAIAFKLPGAHVIARDVADDMFDEAMRRAKQGGCCGRASE